MNTRFKILCVLLGIAYLYIIGEGIVKSMIPTLSSIREEIADKKKHNEHRIFSNSYFFYVKPVKGYYTYPDTILNLKNGKWMRSEVPLFSIRTVNSTELPVWLLIGKIIMVGVSFLLLFLLIYIPIQVYKVIRSVIKNDIFDITNIKRIRRIGYAILAVFACVLYTAFIFTAEAKELFQLENYKIVFSISEDYYYLLIGLVTLLFAEIMKISHTMKEEQDLTI